MIKISTITRSRCFRVVALTFVLAAVCPAIVAPASRGEEEEAQIERRLAVESDVVVTLCLAAGDVVVRGWDRREVRARSDDAEQLELKAAGQSATGAPPPVKQVAVFASKVERSVLPSDGCGGMSNVELDVPRGATIVVKTGSGDLEVSDVAEARLGSNVGDIEVRGITRAVEATSMASGSVFVEDSTVRVRLRSVGGDVEVVNARGAANGDNLIANSTSGSIRLDQVSYSRIEVSTIGGDVRMAGALVRGGSYSFKTYSGDVTLELPPDASFKISARVVADGDILTDFPVKVSGTAPLPPNEESTGRLVGNVGSGKVEADAASLNLSSFHGTLRLRKREPTAGRWQ
ncbi:MAG: DUF4097 family beta strand repeat-containing protein [Pyrinomonadaceae bacterium]